MFTTTFVHQDDFLEVAGPVGDTLAWGGNPQGHNETTSDACVPTVLHQPTLRNSNLAVGARALFTSLRQLHELMNGPRGPELSPTTKVET